MEAASFNEVIPGVYSWEAYSPEHQVDLISHAIVAGSELICFDPIPLAEPAFQKLSKLATPGAIAVTNANHERAGRQWQKRWGTSLWSDRKSGLSAVGMEYFPDEPSASWKGFKLHRISGGSAGEVAFSLEAQSLVLLGDAIVNLPAYPLQLLTEKYCESQPDLKKSLADLIMIPFERLLMAHGRPILHGASKKIAGLLED